AATASATSTGGPAITSVTCTAGAPLAPINSAAPGVSGSANATANSIGLNQASGRITASAASRLATATSKANSTGLFSFLLTTATAPVDLKGNATTISVVNQSAPAFATSNSYQGSSFIVAAPLSSDVTARWSPDANVKNAFGNNAANVNGLLIADVQYPAAGSAAPHTYSSVLELNENNAQLDSNGTIVGMLATLLEGGGAGLLSGDSLRFRIQRQGATLVDQTFTSNPAFLSYFQNTVLLLGPQNAGLGGANLDLQFLFDLTSTHGGAGVGAEF